MTTGSVNRAHLVERALEAMGASPLPVPLGPPAPPAAERQPAEPAERPVYAPAARPLAEPRPAIPMAALREAGLAFTVEAKARSKFMEELALVQHQLFRALEPAVGEARAAARRQIIMVTSARRGEGKSFTSLNIAASMASTTARPVLLVDVDGGASSLTARLGLTAERGLMTLAREKDFSRELPLRPTAIERLSFLPHGSATVAEARAANSDTLALAIRSLASALPRHVLVLDTPPALATSDAQSLAAVAGQVVMVVQAESTQRDEVEAALDLVDNCPLLQLLLNRTRLTTNDSFGAHGDYGATEHA
nr:AAA family ATPase [uncultured Roseococcus sp.]